MISRTTYLPQEQIDLVKHNVIMYGAGTQSTGMILMALNGEFDTKPEFAVFSDTGAEPQHVLDYNQYFSEYVLNEFGFEIITIQHKNLDQEINDYLNGKIKRVAAIPLRTRSEGIIGSGMLRRQCTQDYKIAPLNKLIKQKLRIKRKNKIQYKSVAKWMGISLDEIQRLKTSLEWWNVIVYPLIEKGYRRQDTVNYVKKFGLKEPPRSACYFCPFHSPSYWRYLNDNYPNEFQKAIVFDEKIRNYKGLKQKAYLHRNLKPLKDINFNYQTSLIDMIDECDGYCGS